MIFRGTELNDELMNSQHCFPGNIIMRKPRKLQTDARYHVSARINRREMILEDPAMKELFLQIVARAKKKYDFHIENFTILGNHFHMIIQPYNGSSLSRIMQWISSVFAMAWNRKFNQTGHVWGERFFSRILGSIQEFMKVFDYINENPVKAGLAKSTWDWKYGGTWHFRHKIRVLLGEPSEFLSQLFLSVRTSIKV